MCEIIFLLLFFYFQLPTLLHFGFFRNRVDKHRYYSLRRSARFFFPEVKKKNKNKNVWKAIEFLTVECVIVCTHNEKLALQIGFEIYYNNPHKTPSIKFLHSLILFLWHMAQRWLCGQRQSWSINWHNYASLIKALLEGETLKHWGEAEHSFFYSV